MEKALEMQQLMNIEEFAMRDINELSGGQQQKVFIARALTPENIEHVYGVEVKVNNHDGRPYIVPIRPVR